MLSKSIRIAGILACSTFLAAPAVAKITCCDVDGKRVCGDPEPAQCLARAKKEFNKGVAKDVEAPLTAEQKAAQEAEVARKKEDEKKAAEQERRDRALVASYSSEKEIDAARDRALADADKNAEQARNRLDAAQKKSASLEREKEFYKKKPMPAQLEAEVKKNEREIAEQKKALEQHAVDIDAIKARFEADKERYRKLKGGGK